MTVNDRLFNFGFITLNVLVLFAFCNLTVFYSFYNYLTLLPIDEDWRGMLIGLLSVSAMIFRPLISPLLTPQNAIRGIGLGLAMVTVCLSLYAVANSLLPLILLRIFHGVGYVTMMSSSVTLLMVFMPPKNSGQGFGIISIMTLLPYAVIPLVLENGLSSVAQHKIYAYTALLMLPCALLLIPLSRQLTGQVDDQDPIPREIFFTASLWTNLRQQKIWLLLLVNGLVFSVHALVFFFLKTFAVQIGSGDVGIFFSVSTLVMVIVRFVLGALFDTYDKAFMCILSLGVFAAGLGLLGFVESGWQFYGVAVLYGAGMGVASPLLNGLMFIFSDPRYRGLNTNLMLEMVDGGFFIGPFLGGAALAKGFGQTDILLSCAGGIILAALLLSPFVNKISLNKAI